LNHALAWVGIVAGGLFIVAAIFFSGFFLRWSEMGMGHMAMGHDSMDCCSDMKPGDHMMKPGAMRGPGMMVPHSGHSTGAGATIMKSRPGIPFAFGQQ